MENAVTQPFEANEYEEELLKDAMYEILLSSTLECGNDGTDTGVGLLFDETAMDLFV